MSVLWTAKEAAAATGGEVHGDWTASGVSLDTRPLERGDLFIPLPGMADGHEFVAAALEKVGCRLADVIRTRVYVTDIDRWEEVARAHSAAFGAAPPASTMVEVSRLVNPAMLVEIEADAVVPPVQES